MTFGRCQWAKSYKPIKVLQEDQYEMENEDRNVSDNTNIEMITKTELFSFEKQSNGRVTRNSISDDFQPQSQCLWELSVVVVLHML